MSFVNRFTSGHEVFCFITTIETNLTKLNYIHITKLFSEFLHIDGRGSFADESEDTVETLIDTFATVTFLITVQYVTEKQKATEHKTLIALSHSPRLLPSRSVASLTTYTTSIYSLGIIDLKTSPIIRRRRRRSSIGRINSTPNYFRENRQPN